MPRSVIAAIVLILSALIAGTAGAADRWEIMKASGDYRILIRGAQPASLGKGAQLSEGSTIVTGGTGRVFLFSGKQTMVVGPGSAITVSKSSAGSTRILQHSGEATFEVDRRRIPHFTVETPFLATVVKGTRFTVRVAKSGASVSVDRGVVEVTALASGQRIDAAAGQRVSVSARGKLAIAGAGKLGKIIQGAPQPAKVAPASTGSSMRSASKAASDGSGGDRSTAKNNSTNAVNTITRSVTGKVGGVLSTTTNTVSNALSNVGLGK